MPKLTVAAQKIFGGNLAASGNLAQIGSTITGTPLYTTNPDTIQALTAFLEGFAAQTMGNGSPVLQEQNALNFLITRQLAYLQQAGISEWKADITYYIGSYTNVAGVKYISLQNDNLNHPVTDTAWWRPDAIDLPGTVKLWAPTGLPYGYISCDGTVHNVSAYPVLGALLGATYGGNGTTTFAVPDLRGRTAVGLGTGDAGSATNWTAGRKAGAEKHQLTEPELPVVNGPQASQADNGDAGSYVITAASQAISGFPTKFGANTAHNNLQPSLGLAYIIKT